MDHDEHGLPIGDDGEWLSPETIRAAQAKIKADEFFDEFPEVIGTAVLLSQDDVWIDAKGAHHEIANMDPTYCGNVLRFLERRAQTLEFRYTVATSKLRMTVPLDDDDRFLMAMENYDDVRHATDPPLGFGQEREAWLRDLNEWAWERIRRLPLIEALQAGAIRRNAVVEQFFADDPT